MEHKYLIFIGKGWLPNIPARDLTEEEVKQYGGEKFLLKSGLYVPKIRDDTRGVIRIDDEILTNREKSIINAKADEIPVQGEKEK